MRGFLLLSLMPVIGPLLPAQETARLALRILDTQGAAVPAAAVSLTPTSGARPRTTQSDEQGIVQFAAVTPGVYTLLVTAAGFDDYRVDALRLYTRDFQELRVVLRVRAERASVTVTAEAEGVAIDNATGTTLAGNYASELPVNARNVQSLVSLTAGVTETGGPGGGLHANGLRSNTNYYMVDGVSANTGSSAGAMPGIGGSQVASSALGSGMGLLSMDAMQEFRVQTSTFAPEFGRSPGAQVSMLSRAGTNDFHGSLFHYQRNERFNANDWFSNRDGLPRTANRVLNFGGVLGGALVRDRTFFFASYEGLRMAQPRTVVDTVPSLALRQSASSALRPYLDAFPVPNGPDLGEGGARYSASFATPASSHAGSLRLDHRFDDRRNGFLRYSYSPSSNDSRGGIQNSANTYSTMQAKSQTLTGVYNWTSSDDSFNDIRVNYSRLGTTLRSDMDNFGGAKVPADSLLFPSGVDGASGSYGLLIAGVGGFTRAQGSDNSQDQLNAVFTQSVADESGHLWKVGFDYRLTLPTYQNKNYAAMVMFDGLAGQEGSLTSGKATNLFISGRDGAVYPKMQNFSAYLQDNYHASSRLTLTYGIRWDLNPAPGVRSGQKPLGLDDSYNLSDSKPLYRTNWLNLAPRLGFAWQQGRQPNRGVVLRGGIGWFYDIGYGGTAAAFESAPYVSSTITNTPAFPLTATDKAAPPFPPRKPYGQVTAGDPMLKSPRVRQFSLSLERWLGNGQVVSATYVNTAGRNLLRQQTYPGFFTTDYNLLQLTANGATSDYHGLQVQFRRSFGGYVQAQANYTWSHSIDTSSSDGGGPGLAFLFGDERGSSNFDLRHNFNANGTLRFPQPRVPVLRQILGGWSTDWTAVARTGFPFDVRGLTRSFGNAESGSTNTRAFFAQVRPDYTGAPVFVDDPQAPGGRRWNRAAFADPPDNQQGNLGRNVLRGFGYVQGDVALRRQIRMSEGVSLQLRLDAFNVLNQPSFADPSPNEGANLSSPNFGVSTRMFYATAGRQNVSQAPGAPRSLQLSLRVQF